MSAIARAQKTKGENFLNQAQATLQKRTWFASSSEQKYEDAAELFEKAANAYKVGSLFSEAGDAYKRAAKIYSVELKNSGEASKCLTNAGSCFKKASPPDAIEAYREAITLLCDAGRLTQAAKLSKEIGDIFDSEIGANDNDENVTLAIESYEQAADLFGMEDSKSQQSQCLVKVADLLSAALEPPDLQRSASIYENLGTQCLDSNLLKYNAKGYFTQSVFCHLANGDAIGASQALQKFGNLDFTLGDSREGKFCARLIECVENFDTDDFATACFEYDRISKLNPWQTSMLVKVKRSIDDQDGLGGDDDDIDLT